MTGVFRHRYRYVPAYARGLAALSIYSEPPPEPNLWTPDDDDSLSINFWIDASDASTITKDGSDLVSAWNDKSGNGYNLTQATGSAKPLWTSSNANLNSLPTIGPVDAGDFMSVASAPIPFEFIWWQRSDIGDEFTHLWVYHTSGLWNFYSDPVPDAPGNYLVMISPRSGAVVDDDDVFRLNGSPLPIQAKDSNAISDKGTAFYVLRVRSQPGSFDSEVARLHTIAGNGAPTFFNTEFTNRTLDADIAEIIHLSDIADLATIEKIEGYLAWKWGMEGDLPSGHTYKNDPPTSDNGYSGSLTETVGWTGSFVKSVDAASSLTETLAWAGSVAKTVAASGSLTQTAITWDAEFFPEREASPSLTDTLTWEGAFDTLRAFSGALEETLVWEGTYSPSDFPARTLSLTETLEWAGVWAGARSAAGSLSETLTWDAVTVASRAASGAVTSELVWEGGFLPVRAGGASLSETVDWSGTYLKDLAVSLSLTESTAWTGDTLRTAVASTTLEEAVSWDGSFAKISAFALSLTETVALQLGDVTRDAYFSGALTETVEWTGIYGEEGVPSRTLSLTETAAWTGDYITVRMAALDITETMFGTPLITTLRIRTVSLTEDAAWSGAVEKSTPVTLTVEETSAWLGTGAKIGVLPASLSEACVWEGGGYATRGGVLTLSDTAALYPGFIIEHHAGGRTLSVSALFSYNLSVDSDFEYDLVIRVTIDARPGLSYLIGRPHMLLIQGAPWKNKDGL